MVGIASWFEPAQGEGDLRRRRPSPLAVSLLVFRFYGRALDRKRFLVFGTATLVDGCAAVVVRRR
jgi:hypothetical protein